MLLYRRTFTFLWKICFWNFLLKRRTCALKMGFTFFKSWLEVTSYWLVTLIIFLSVGTCPLPSPGREDFFSGEYIYSEGRTSFKIGGTFFMLMWKLFCPKHLGGGVNYLSTLDYISLQSKTCIFGCLVFLLQIFE